MRPIFFIDARAIAALIAAAAFAVQAQEAAKEQVAESPAVVEAPDTERVAAEPVPNPARHTRATHRHHRPKSVWPAAPTCITTSDCAAGFTCSDYRFLGDGKWSSGACLPTPTQASASSSSAHLLPPSSPLAMKDLRLVPPPYVPVWPVYLTAGILGSIGTMLAPFTPGVPGSGFVGILFVGIGTVGVMLVCLLAVPIIAIVNAVRRGEFERRVAEQSTPAFKARITLEAARAQERLAHENAQRAARQAADMKLRAILSLAAPTANCTQAAIDEMRQGGVSESAILTACAE